MRHFNIILIRSIHCNSSFFCSLGNFVFRRKNIFNYCNLAVLSCSKKILISYEQYLWSNPPEWQLLSFLTPLVELLNVKNKTSYKIYKKKNWNRGWTYLTPESKTVAPQVFLIYPNFLFFLWNLKNEMLVSNISLNKCN